MTVTEVIKDHDARQLQITAEFDAPAARVFELWSDPRKLERWWGPPEFPATFVEYDLRPGARAAYYMTGPDGQQFHGWWRILRVDAPDGLEFEDGFADETGQPNEALPTTTAVVTLAARPSSGTRMVIRTTFSSAEAMEQVLAMGAEEGMTLAMNQMDEILREG